MKNGNLRTAFLLLLVAFLILFGVASFTANMRVEGEDRITASTISITNDNTIRVPNSDQALPSKEEGTIVVWTRSPIKVFDQFSDARDYIILFTATNIPGLRIVYNIQEQRFEAGTPLLTSPQINIFDEKDHEVVYTFKRDIGQALFIDGAEVGFSEFRPAEVSQITGFATALHSISEADIEGLEVAMYDRYMTQEYLAKI